MAFTSNSSTNVERVLYYNKATHASPSWVEMKRARNVKASPNSKARGDVSRRDSKYRYSRGSTRELGLTFQYVYSTAADTIWDDLQASLHNGTPYEFFDSDRSGTGAEGYRFVGEVVNIEQADESDEAGTVYDIEVALTDAEESSALLEPDWYTYTIS